MGDNVKNVAVGNASNVIISSIRSSPKKFKKRPLDPSIGSISGSLNKKRKIEMNDDSDDDVLRGLHGRENELNMNGFDKNKNDEAATLDVFGDTIDSHLQSQQEREEMQRRQELKERLERNKNDKKRQMKKKKKKKKAKLRI